MTTPTIAKGKLLNKGSKTCLSFNGGTAEMANTSSAIKILIIPVGNDCVCIATRDELGELRILDNNKGRNFVFTTHDKPDYTDSQRYIEGNDGGTYKFRQGGAGNQVYLSVDTSNSVEGVLVLKPLETDEKKIEFQKFVLISPPQPSVSASTGSNNNSRQKTCCLV